MSFNGSGVFVINSAGQPVVATTLITAAAMNALTADLATGLSLCLTKDGQQVPTANIPMGTFKITGLGDGASLQDATTLKNIQNGTGVYVATVGGTADAITLTPSPAITAYVAGQTFRFLASGPNTTAATVAISGLAAKAITKNGSTALVAGDIPSAILVAITYDGTRFQLTSGLSLPFSIIDAAGDLVYGTANDTAARLAIGTARQVLRVNAGATAPAWDTQITLATPQASTSGTSIDFTSIPSGVKRITIALTDVSTNGTSALIVQLGDSGGIEVASYLGHCVTTVTGSTSSLTSGLEITGAITSSSVMTGLIICTLQNAATNMWVMTSNVDDSSVPAIFVGVSQKATSAELDRVRITTIGGVNTFDAGAINIAYE